MFSGRLHATNSRDEFAFRRRRWISQSESTIRGINTSLDAEGSRGRRFPTRVRGRGTESYKVELKEGTRILSGERKRKNNTLVRVHSLFVNLSKCLNAAPLGSRR